MSKLSVFYISWDVGGWNCEKNANSRDALAILDADLNLIGQPWRGNLTDAINWEQHLEIGTTNGHGLGSRDGGQLFLQLMEMPELLERSMVVLNSGRLRT
jgi:hypothetical protein